ncbi:hypothetical protein [Larkinella arboricola]|nr:hypothetical protein [Larkinella arboricola]
MIIQKPHNFPNLKTFLKDRGIDAYHLQEALDDYLIDVDETIRQECDQYEKPHEYIQAKHYEQATERFRDALTSELDD